MNALNELIQNLEFLYQQQPATVPYQKTLNKLRTMGLSAIRTIIDLAMTENSEKKLFLFNLISELGNKRAVRILSGIAHAPDTNDDLKLLAIMTIIRLGGKINFEALFAGIENFEMLGRYFVYTSLNEAYNPMFIEDFIDQFYMFYENGESIVLDEFLNVKNDNRIIPLVSALIEVADAYLQHHLIILLLNTHSRQAFPALQEIIQRAADAEIEQFARNTIFKIAQQKPVEGEIDLLYKFHKAFITSCDGSGSQICIFSVKTISETIRLIAFVNNDTQGIKDAFGLELTVEEFKLFLVRMKHEIMYEITQVEAEDVLSQKQASENLNISTGTPFPMSYLAWRQIFDCSNKTKRNEKNAQKFNGYVDNLKEQVALLLPQTPHLYEFDEINMSWFIDFEEVEMDLNDLAIFKKMNWLKNLQKIKTNHSSFYTRIFNQVFTSDFLKLLEKRLYQFGYICFLNGAKEKSKLAIVAALGLSAVPPDHHPLLHKMLTFSIEIYQDQWKINTRRTPAEFFGRDSFEEYSDDSFDELNEDDAEAPEEAAFSPFPENRFKHFYLDNIRLPSDFKTCIKNKKPLLISRKQINLLTNLERLYLINGKLPNLPFSKVFPGSLVTLNPKETIKWLYLCETNFDFFISTTVGSIDWEQLREELDLRIDPAIVRGQLKKIEELFLRHSLATPFTEEHLNFARRSWKEFIFLNNGIVNGMNEPAPWAAGIEYLVRAIYFIKISQQEIADYYGTSVGSLSSRFHELKTLLNIKIYTSDSQKHYKQFYRLLTPF